jgi:hypothetical protein
MKKDKSILYEKMAEQEYAEWVKLKLSRKIK